LAFNTEVKASCSSAISLTIKNPGESDVILTSLIGPIFNDLIFAADTPQYLRLYSESGYY